jgi:hypothetical protein
MIHITFSVLFSALARDERARKHRTTVTIHRLTTDKNDEGSNHLIILMIPSMVELIIMSHYHHDNALASIAADWRVNSVTCLHSRKH